MEYLEIKSNTTKSRSIRADPIVTAPKKADLFPGQIAKALTTAESVFVFPNDVPNTSGGFHARAGDQWRKVYEVDGVGLAGWIAQVHLGELMIESKLITDATPPPPGDNIDVRVNKFEDQITVIVDDQVYKKQE